MVNVRRLVIAALLSLPTQVPDVLAQVKEPGLPEAAAILAEVRDTVQEPVQLSLRARSPPGGDRR